MWWRFLDLKKKKKKWTVKIRFKCQDGTLTLALFTASLCPDGLLTLHRVVRCQMRQMERVIQLSHTVREEMTRQAIIASRLSSFELWPVWF